VQEIFDKTPIEKFEDMVADLRKSGDTKAADDLAYLIATIRFRMGTGKKPR
jgi:hypothetical protein